MLSHRQVVLLNSVAIAVADAAIIWFAGRAGSLVGGEALTAR